MIFLFIIVGLLVVYAILIEAYRKWFLQLKPFQATGETKQNIHFSVIIPARNEEENIEACLQSVLNQNYPSDLFEVIVIDDFSTDKTAGLIQALQKKYNNLRLIQLEKELESKPINSYKKKAIELAIQKATGDWIITTDADCIVNKLWLKTYNDFIETKQPVFVAAPVQFINNGSFLSIFQSLDFISLQGITMASVSKNFHSMCNGANLSYSKKVFVEVGGFSGIDNIASGDDMLLMHKIFLKYPQQVQFLYSPDVIVKTQPMPTWKTFINPRIRWASKADKYDDKRIFWVLALVYFLNVSILLFPIAGFWLKHWGMYWVILFALKTFIELRVMYPVAKFFKEEKLLWWFPFMQPFHVLYTVIAGWLGKFGKYQWKERTVK